MQSVAPRVLFACPEICSSHYRHMLQGSVLHLLVFFSQLVLHSTLVSLGDLPECILASCSNPSLQKSQLHSKGKSVRSNGCTSISMSTTRLHLPSPPNLRPQDGDHADVALDPFHPVLSFSPTNVDPKLINPRAPGLRIWGCSPPKVMIPH